MINKTKKAGSILENIISFSLMISMLLIGYKTANYIKVIYTINTIKYEIILEDPLIPAESLEIKCENNEYKIKNLNQNYEIKEEVKQKIKNNHSNINFI